MLNGTGLMLAILATAIIPFAPRLSGIPLKAAKLVAIGLCVFTAIKLTGALTI
ncbi:MAG: hypothetical protein V4474_02435 [Patescibacteria group bacterium]